MIRLLAFVQKRPGLSPGQRYRLEQWAPHLRARHGIDLEFAVFESPRTTEILYASGHRVEKGRWLLHDTWRRRDHVRKARDYDGVVVYREAASLGPAIYERLLVRQGTPLFFDFDDAIWIPGVGSVNGVFSRLRFQGKTATICRLASAVMVGNHYLADYARRYSHNVHVVPTTIELADYPPQPPLPPVGATQPFVITWSGSLSTLIHLEEARAPIEALGRRRDVILRVICSEPPARPIEGVKLEFVKWRAATEAADVGATHVGIMPLPDDEFARGKCALKGLQYMATGRPAILSPVGVNAEIVRHGENGLLARSERDWIDALESLAASAELSERLGRAGRRTVEEGFSAERSAARFAEVVKTTLGGA